MKSIKFIIPFPDINYYLWQVLVQINNFRKMGYEVDTYYVGCCFDNKVSDNFMRMIKSKNIKAKFFLFHDSRPDKSYTASIKPWLMSQYFKMFPEEKNSVYVYLDPDVIFLKHIDWQKYANDNIWYESDTCNYLNSNYIKSKGDQLFLEMCNIVGILPETVVENDNNAGGAQYVIKNNTYKYWEEVERLSTLLYRHMINTAKKYTPENNLPIQAWTSEMWVTNWVLWKYGRKTQCIPEFHFHWANHMMKDLQYAIYHNAGVFSDDGVHFSKIAYQVSPFNKPIKCTEESLSYLYFQEVKDTEKNFPELLF